MSHTDKPLPHLLYQPSERRAPVEIERRNVDRLRKPARAWLGPEKAKLSKGPLIAALEKALKDDGAAKRVLDALSADERTVASVYRRYGGTVDGEVIRVDLMARGLLEVVETRVTEHYTRKKWKRNPVGDLAERLALPPDGLERDDYYYSYSYGYGGYGGEPDQPFARYSLHAGIAALVEPAGPAPWSIPEAQGVPHAVTRRTAAEVALDLSRVFAYVASRESVKVRKGGVLATPTLRALEKAVPLDDGSEFALPEPQGLYFELLVRGGAIRVAGNEAVADRVVAARMFDADDARQAHSWARGWLTTRHWTDGSGVAEAGDDGYGVERIPAARRVLTWALGCLAHAGGRWYDLGDFLKALGDLQGTDHYLPVGGLAWDPKISATGHKPRTTGRDTKSVWYANALMVTLVTLGLVERGRMGRAADAPHAFRLTDLGLAVFGAPEVVPKVNVGERRFFVIQPNFDVLAYVDQADAATAALLGRIAESDSTASGPVQTFRLTQSSVYQAQEGGIDHGRIVAFLDRHARAPAPPNVVRSLADWAGRREAMVLRSGVNVLGFQSEAERDAHLKRHPGTACGERFALMTDGPKGRPRVAGALVVDHSVQQRRTLRVDEHGNVTVGQPLDVVQRARLRRVTDLTEKGWRLTADSVRRAAAAGLKPTQVRRWLSEHLEKPLPPLIDGAIDAWSGKARPLGLDNALLLHVPEIGAFQSIAASRRLRAFVLGSPGPHWLIVRREASDELAAALKELGFTVDRHLSFDGDATVEKG